MRLRLSLGLLSVIVLALLFFQACGTGGGSTSPVGQPDTGGSNAQFHGVLKWKGSNSGAGLYSETTLTPQNVNPAQFGKVAKFYSEGVVHAQPLFVSNLDMGSLGVHDVIIVANERNQVLAFDASGKTTQPLWQRSYLGPGITTVPDNFGGRTNIGGEIGITGTPVIDPATGAMYFVTMLLNNGTPEQWLRAIDIRTGKDFGPGSVKIKASVPGDGPGSSNGQVPFNPGIQNQRAALALANGNVLIGWGSFSDWGVYRGWLMAYDVKTLEQTAVYSPSTQYQAQDSGGGPADHGGGASIWQAGASPAVDSAGNIYVVAGDGSFNADSGGKNHGDSVLRMTLSNGALQVADYFTPSNHDCINKADLEIGSGGLALLPTETTGSPRAVAISKEGRVYLLDPGRLGGLTGDDSQIPQVFLAGNRTCTDGIGGGHAEGTDWQRLYGNVSYWNGNIYLAPANSNLRQYAFTGSTLSTTPASTSTTQFWLRGANTVISANGNSNGIVWAYSKNRQGVVELHAYDATNLAHELWSNYMKAGRDAIGAGTPFGVPVVANGKVIVAGRNEIAVYGLLQ